MASIRWWTNWTDWWTDGLINWVVTLHLLPATAPLPAENNIISLKVIMSLGAFNVLVCEQNCNIADIKIQGTKGQLKMVGSPGVTWYLIAAIPFSPSGINGSVLMQGPQTHISARLRDFVVLNADSNSIHKKVSCLTTPYRLITPVFFIQTKDRLLHPLQKVFLVLFYSISDSLLLPVWVHVH